MDWITRLNRTVGRFPLGSGRVEVLHWSYEPQLADNMPHRHTFYEACLVGPRGKGVFRTEKKTYELTPGTCFVARPGVVHQIQNTETPGMDLRWVCFGLGQEESLRSDVDRLMAAFTSTEVSVAPHSERLTQLWAALQVVAEGPLRLGSVGQIEALIASVLVEIAHTMVGESAHTIEVETGEPTNRSVVRHALRYIEDNLNRPLSLEEIAAHASVSPRHLTRLFADVVGTSPARYVLLARLDRASAMLARGDMPIKEVANETGFADVQYLTRCFTKQYGVPPGVYRKNGGGGRRIQNPGSLV